MQAYEFYAVPENGFIPIPKQYRNKIQRNIKVIILDEKSGEKSDLLLPPSLDTEGWEFDKEEANAR